jgi:hypothetical protein
VHLESIGRVCLGGARNLRRGARSPFRILWLPQWQIEGWQPWEESTLTAEGRRVARATSARFERVAAAAGRPLSLDRASGGLVGWPDGHAAYAAGLGFHEYLVERFGQESPRPGRARSTSRRLPFLGRRPTKRCLGESLGLTLRDYQQRFVR